MTRILRFSTPNGEREYVYFTEDLSLLADSIQRPGFDLDSDDIIDEEMPGGFPLDYELERN